MGLALARSALEMGANVTLITTLPVSNGEQMEVISVETAAEMLGAVEKMLPANGVLIMAAAVADYQPASVSPTKVKKNSDAWNLELVPTVDILQEVGEKAHEQHTYVVGFAAETNDHVANAQKKLIAKGLDLVVLNDVFDPSVGFESDDNAVTIIDINGIVAKVERALKQAIAKEILSIIASRFGNR